MARESVLSLLLSSSIPRPPWDASNSDVLLSFAQFEREVTGERIRDKVAASKKKGMWMGGIVPLGYDHKDRQLHVNEAEAQQGPAHL